MYTYKAKYVSNYDGDTVRFDIDLGFGVVLKNQIVRLYGINCPEIIGANKEAAKNAKEFVASSLLSCSDIVIKTHKDTKEKYGRWLAEVFFTTDNKEHNLNELLVAQNLAITVNY